MRRWLQEQVRRVDPLRPRSDRPQKRPVPVAVVVMGAMAHADRVDQHGGGSTRRIEGVTKSVTGHFELPTAGIEA